MDTATIGYFIVGLCFVALGIPLVRRRIPRNRWYGFRVAKTFSSERIWYDANEVAGRDLVVAGAVIAGTALLLPRLFSSLDPVTVATIDFAVFLTAMIAATVHSAAALKRM